MKEGAQRVCDGCYSYYSGGFVFGSSGDSDNYWMIDCLSRALSVLGSELAVCEICRSTYVNDLLSSEPSI